MEATVTMRTPAALSAVRPAAGRLLDVRWTADCGWWCSCASEADECIHVELVSIMATTGATA